MSVRVTRAMIVPAAVQGGANGCKVANHLQRNRDLGLQAVGMEKKSKGGAENGKQGGHESAVTWHRNTSESSISSNDSLPAVESFYSPSDMSHPLYRKARLGPQTSESDEDSVPDSTQDEYLNKKFRRPYVGGTLQPHLATSFNADEAVPDHGSTPSDDGKDPSSRVKFMCSFGGKILPRPSDGKLRYVGGDTKIIAVNRDTNFSELMAKMREVYGQALTLKYQLPDEDLDALVSVSSNEDLQNMMEEYDKLEAEGSSRLRVFLFPTVDYDTSLHHKDSTGDLRNSEQRYVDAVNGIPEVGPRIRTESYASGATAAYSVDNLMGLEVPESWNLPRDPVPVALLAAHDVASHIHRVPVAVPVSTITSRPNAPPSAPSSAPSSPPLLPRPVIAKPPVVPDIHLPYQDAHLKLGTQYNVLLGEGNYQDSESYGGSGGSSGTSQHDPLYRSSDSRRGVESPPRKQLDSGHQDHTLRAEQRRLTEAKVPRVPSHGKLSRLVEHVELGPPSPTDTQQLPELHLPPAEMQRLLQQKQQPFNQAVWQHPMDSQPDSFRRADLLQSTVTQNAVLGQHQQGYPASFRAGHSQSHESVYRQGEPQQYPDEVMLQLPRVVSSHSMTPIGAALGQSTSYHGGSAPSSPRLGFRDVARHVPGQQQGPIHWPFAGTAFAEQPSYGRRITYGDQGGRGFRVSNSPPKYREQLAHADERLLREQQQQSLSSSDPLHNEQVLKSGQLVYEANPVPTQYDLLSRPQLPLYKGHNPFQEKLISYQDQEIGDLRRHQLSQQGLESQFLSGQQHLHSLHQNQRLEFQEPVQSVDQFLGHSRYQETQRKVSEWDSDEARLGFRVRPRTGQLDDELLAESGGPHHHREIQQTNYPGLNLPETSDDLLSMSIGDYASSGFQFRQGMLPSSALGGYSGPKSRTNLTDPTLVSRFISRQTEPEHLLHGGHRVGGSGQDARSAVYDVNGHQHTSSAIGRGLASGSHRMEERLASAFSPITQQMQNLRIGDNHKVGADIRWNGGLGPEDIRVDVPIQGRDLSGGLYEDHNGGHPSVAIGRSGRLSRPSSSTNIPSLLEGELGDAGHVHAYGTQYNGGHPSMALGRSGRLSRPSSSTNIPSLLEGELGDAGHVHAYGSQCIPDEDDRHPYGLQGVPVVDNPLFTTTSTRYAHPPPVVESTPVTSAGRFLFDATPPGSLCPDYHNLVIADDGPNIKTIATQVPSVEGDISGGSTSTIGGSDRSDSSCGSGEHAVGQLTMTQLLAEDVASCVLESTAVKAPSQVQAKEATGEEEIVATEGESTWPLEPAPILPPDLWENALEEAEDGKDKHATEENTGDEALEKESSKAKDDCEAFQVGSHQAMDQSSTGSNAAEVAAAEAIAHGLQTIKNADLEELRELGSGTFGTVYHGKWRGTDVAIKRIKASCFAGRPSEQERLIADFWREACNLGNLHHPNVVAFYGVVSDGPGGTLATVTEYMVNGSLKQVLQKKDRTIDRRKRLLIAMDSAFGMEYLHGKNIVHFDLKCENLLVNMRDPHRPICKVGDLGLSKVKHQTMVSGGVRGTLPWMAPELLNGSSSLVTEKVDVFSFGIVMWELLTGEEPYANMHYGAIIGGIVNNTLRPPIPSWCDPAWRSLMERCWAAEPGSRPSFSEIASELRVMADGLKPKSQHPSSTQAQS